MKYVFDIPEEMIKSCLAHEFRAIDALSICLEEQIDDMYDEVDTTLNR